MGEQHLTTNQGAPVDNRNSRAAGQREPALTETNHLVEQPEPFDRDRIAERVVHTRGAGARGVFVAERSMAAHTKAHFVQNAGQETPVFVRFSTVIRGQDSRETIREPRGFAVKFYTQEGHYDIVGSHLPVFDVRDAIKLPDKARTLASSPDTSLRTPSRYWEFMTLSPESTHLLAWLFSNDGTPANYRQMNGFGVYAVQWINAEGKSTYVKYHWKSKQGVVNFTAAEAAGTQARDGNHAIRDLYAAIELGSFPQWELYVQLLPPEAGDALPFDPLDATKTWPEDRLPPVKIGTMTLNWNPISYFTEVERSVFAPDTLVPGIGLPEARLPKGEKTDDFSQAGERYRTLPEAERDGLVRNLIGELRQVPQQTQLRAACNFFRADVQFGLRLAEGLGIDLGEYMQRSQ